MANAPKDQNNVPWPNGRFARSVVVDTNGVQSNLTVDHTTGNLLAVIVAQTVSGSVTQAYAGIDTNSVTSMLGQNPSGTSQAMLVENTTGNLIGTLS